MYRQDKAIKLHWSLVLFDICNMVKFHQSQTTTNKRVTRKKRDKQEWSRLHPILFLDGLQGRFSWRVGIMAANDDYFHHHLICRFFFG